MLIIITMGIARTIQWFCLGTEVLRHIVLGALMVVVRAKTREITHTKRSKQAWLLRRSSGEETIRHY